MIQLRNTNLFQTVNHWNLWTVEHLKTLDHGIRTVDTLKTRGTFARNQRCLFPQHGFCPVFLLNLMLISMIVFKTAPMKRYSRVPSLATLKLNLKNRDLKCLNLLKYLKLKNLKIVDLKLKLKRNSRQSPLFVF